MEFESLEAYNKQPLHLDFIKNFWLNYVEEFLELDFEAQKS